MIGRWLWRWFDPPPVEDESIKQMIRRLNALLLFSIGVNLVNMVLLAANPFGTDASVLASVIILLLQGAGLALLNRLLRDKSEQTTAQLRALTEQNQQLQKEIESRKQAETDLRASHEQIQALVASSPASVMVHGANGHVLYANQAAARLLGAESVGKLVGQASTDYMPQVYLTIAAEQFAKAETGKAFGPAEYRVQRLDQQIVDVHIHSMLMRFQEQPALLDVMMDLTAQKRAQQELVTAEILKIELNKEREIVDLKEQFVSMVSHEFRNPLTTILTSKEILERYSERLTPQSRAEHLHQIGSQVQFMVELLNNVLTISRAQAHGIELNLEPTDLKAFCQSVFQQIQQQDGSKHEFEFETSGDLNAIPADRKIMTHILSHLVGNAVKFSPAGTPVHLRVSRVGDALSIQVEDKGIGIPQDEQAKLFEPFRRARNTSATLGSGLGLAIVKESVRAHGGIVSFESQEGSGTTFTVKLPCPLPNNPAS